MTFKQHLPVTKADVLSYIRKKPAFKTAGGTCQDDVLMTYWWRIDGDDEMRHGRGHELQRCRQRVELLVDLYSQLAGSTQSKQLCIKLLYRYKPAKTSRITMLIYFLYFKLDVTLSGACQSRCYGKIHSGIETFPCSDFKPCRDFVPREINFTEKHISM